MTMPCLSKTIVIFDLDDTLYSEEDFLKSGYKVIAKSVSERLQIESPYNKMLQWRIENKNVFDELCSVYRGHITKEECLCIYRNHIPNIYIDAETLGTLKTLKTRGYVLGIITDGREKTQLNKIQALELFPFVNKDDIVISEAFGTEKPCIANYQYFMHRYPNAQYIYVGDNPKKDFIAPNYLGWKTFCLLDRGNNIHKQSFDFPEDWLAQMNINKLSEIEMFI